MGANETLRKYQLILESANERNSTQYQRRLNKELAFASSELYSHLSNVVSQYAVKIKYNR